MIVHRKMWKDAARATVLYITICHMPYVSVSGLEPEPLRSNGRVSGLFSSMKLKQSSWRLKGSLADEERSLGLLPPYLCKLAGGPAR